MRVMDARFGSFGCVPAIAAASIVSAWAVGRTVEEAMRLTASEVVDMLGGVPDERRFCCELAVDALHGAVRAATCGAEAEPDL